MAENRIGPQQSRGHHFKCLNGIAPGFTVGQGGTSTMGPAMDALATVWKTDVEAVGVGLPLGDPTNVLNGLAGSNRFVVFALNMVPTSGGSLQRLLNGDYDTLHQGTAAKLVAKGWGLNCTLRIGWEYNAGTGKPDNQGFPWATNWRDPYTGLINGLSQYLLAAAYVENIYRKAGFAGYVSWCGGNSDTSSAPIAQAIPQHGDPSLTLWDYDLYAPNPYNGSRQNVAASIAASSTQYDKYLAYCEANGLLMGHGEYGQTYSASSPYFINGIAGWMAWLYGKLRTNNRRMAYAVHYQKNQTVTGSTVLSEMHQLWGANGWTGSPSTIKDTTPYAVGATAANQVGSAHTIDTMGNQQSAATGNTATFWTPTADPNKVDVLKDWMDYFGGNNAANGSAGLAQPDPLVIPAASFAVTLDTERRRRRTTFGYA